MHLVGIHRLLFYADDVNILGGSVHTVKENAEALVVATKEIGLEVNADKTMYMVMSRDQSAGRSHNIKIDSSFFERVEHLKYLGTNLTNQNCIREEIKRRLKSGNACYHSVQNLLSFNLLSIDMKIKINRIMILRAVMYGCETWFLKLREERRLRVFESRMLRKTLGPKGAEVTGEWRRLHKDELNDSYCSVNIVRVINNLEPEFYI